MKLFLIAAIALAAAPALAQEDLMAAAYGNTVTMDVQGVWTARMFINANGTYSQVSTDGPAKGTWKRKGDQHCFTQTEPAGQAETCSPAAARKVGDTWESTDSNGITATVGIVADRAPETPAAPPAG